MNKIDMGGQLPEFTLQVGVSETINLPSDIESDYAVILFYRGHWWPYCIRQLGGYEKNLEALRDLGVSVFAATVDSLAETTKVAQSLSFPVAWGVDKQLGDLLGAFWENRRDHIQPTEFLVNKKGRVLSSTYSTSPLGRMDADETVTLMKMITARKQQWSSVRCLGYIRPGIANAF